MSTVDVIFPYSPNHTLFQSPYQMLTGRTQFWAIATHGGNITAIGGDAGGDSEDVMTCPPQFTGPDCNQPDAATCNYGYLWTGGTCVPWCVKRTDGVLR